MNILGNAEILAKGTISAARSGEADVNVNGVDVTVVTDKAVKVGDEGEIVLRPEAIVIAKEGQLPCTVELSCFMGSYQNYHVMVGDTLVKLEEHNPKNKHIYQVGDTCRLVFDPKSVHVL